MPTLKTNRESLMTIDQVVELLAQYRPASTDPDQIWPPVVSCQSWDNQTLPHALHYAVDDVKEIITMVREQELDRGEIIITDFRNGLPCLVWEQIFPKVISIVSDRFLDHGPIVEGKQTILFGGPADTVFLYRAMEHFSHLKVLLIDDLYYGNIISLYFMFKKLIKPPGAVVFLNSGNRVPEHAGMHRFLQDLSKGALDNLRHKLTHLHNNPKGYGVSYELIN
jgi:hypothetical protein